MGRVGERDRRRARRGELSGLDRDVDHLARAAGVQHVPSEQLLLERELRLRLGDPCACTRDLLGAGAVAEGGQPLFERLAIGDGATQVGLRPVELGLGEGAVGEELARPLGVRALQGFRRDGAVQLVGQRRDVFLA